jgi:hypothetical protein
MSRGAPSRPQRVGFCHILVAIVFLASPVLALAQTDEIQVYDANIAEVGKFNLMVHDNFTPSGRTTPAFPGAVISNRALVGVAEWAYGVTAWFEQGLYLPLYSHSENLGATYNGFKIRELFVRPHADDHTFFYGLNFEFSVNQKQWDPRRITSELRPIMGWHLHPIDIIVNPIMDTSYTHGVKGLDFAPEIRVAYNLSKTWAVAGEEYSDLGQFRGIVPLRAETHQMWAVVDKSNRILNIEAGVGFGLTPASDKVTLKLMLSRDLN